MGNRITQPRVDDDASVRRRERSAQQQREAEQRRLEEAERARQAEAERRRRVEEATARRVEQELKAQRQKDFIEFAKIPYGLLLVPVVYNIFSYHAFVGGLAMAAGGYMKLHKSYVAKEHEVLLSVVALFLGATGDMVSSLWEPLGQCCHGLCFFAELWLIDIVLRKLKGTR